MSTEVIEAFYQWVSREGRQSRRRSPDDRGFHHYFLGIAEARHVVRKVFRIVDEQARRYGLEPLEHQTLIQVFGSPESSLRVNEVAERLDIAPAFASRLVRSLEGRELVKRSASPRDRRITMVEVTAEGRRKLAEIDEQVHVHVEYFQRQLDDSARVAALGIFAFYLGAVPDVRALERLLDTPKR